MLQFDEIASSYVEDSARLDPVEALTRGDLRYSAELTDYSPSGEEARAECARRAVHRALVENGSDSRLALGRTAMVDRLRVMVDLFDAGEWMRGVSVFGPQLQIRSSFDLMRHDDDSDWTLIAQKMELVPKAIAGFEASLRQGIQRRFVASRRQALVCAAQTRAWSGAGPGAGFFSALAARYPGHDTKLGEGLLAGARLAEAAYWELTEFLEKDYGPAGALTDGVGSERYSLAVRQALGTELVLDEAYAFGWSELSSVEHEMELLAEHIAPGKGVAGTVRLLEHDPDRAVDGVANFLVWNQSFLDRTMAELNGTHFDIPEPVLTVEAMIAPPGGSPAMYYTPPASDFSRPGRTWYPTLGRTRFPLWNEVSTAYHEGVPGHHLQLAQTCYLAPELHPFQTMLGAVSGHVEGWALYAERLMGELGYLENPDYGFGLLASQAMRAARVVVDTGLHLGLKLPHGQSFHPGELWTWELAVEFMMRKSLRSRTFCAGEVDRYLGVPAQAISYKLGEKVWLEARDAARKNCGSSFDHKEFHRHALGLGCVGLEQLRQEMERLGPEDMSRAGVGRRASAGSA